MAIFLWRITAKTTSSRWLSVTKLSDLSALWHCLRLAFAFSRLWEIAADALALSLKQAKVHRNVFVCKLASLLNVVFCLMQIDNRTKDTASTSEPWITLSLFIFPFAPIQFPPSGDSSRLPLWYDLADSALTEYLNYVTDADHDQQTGVVEVYRLSDDSAAIEPVDLGAQPLQCFVCDTNLLSPSIHRCLHIDPERPRSSNNNRLTLIDATTCV
jgi:hypothetical protein